MAGQQAEKMHLLHANSKAPVEPSVTGTFTKLGVQYLSSVLSSRVAGTKFWYILQVFFCYHLSCLCRVRAKCSGSMVTRQRCIYPNHASYGMAQLPVEDSSNNMHFTHHTCAEVFMPVTCAAGARTTGACQFLPPRFLRELRVHRVAVRVCAARSARLALQSANIIS